MVKHDPCHQGTAPSCTSGINIMCSFSAPKGMSQEYRKLTTQMHAKGALHHGRDMQQATPLTRMMIMGTSRNMSAVVRVNCRLSRLREHTGRAQHNLVQCPVLKRLLQFLYKSTHVLIITHMHALCFMFKCGEHQCIL